MENRAHAIAVGLFTILLGFALFFAFWWLSGAKQSLTEYYIVSNLPVTGLNAEASVKFRGVNVGKITDISLKPGDQTSIIISIEVAESLVLNKSAFAQIRSRGVTGLAYIDLDNADKTSPRLVAGATIPLRPSMIDGLLERGPALVSQFETLLKNSSEVTTTANQVLKKIDVEKLNKTIANLEHASAKLDTTLGSVSTAADKISGMMSDKHQLQFSQTMESVRKTSDAAQPLLGELGDTAREFKGMAQEIGRSANQITDTLNHETLPGLHQFLQSSDHDLRHFDQLLDSLDENPQSLIFGKPIAAPGPGENGFNPKP
jgi:phospholipid/cholesterol/gamma-HCH transport system substrate-binding protein